jgi:hypothetical protein
MSRKGGQGSDRAGFAEQWRLERQRAKRLKRETKREAKRVGQGQKHQERAS